MNVYVRPVTPATRSLAIESLCRELCPGTEPQYIDVRPEPDREANDCFVIVSERIARDGGRQQVGWSIWEWPTLFVEAEFHAVWQPPNEAAPFLDIARKASPVDRIFFLPAADAQYEGRQVNNVRRALHNHAPVLDLFAACEAEYELLNRGERAEQHGEIHLSAAETQEMMRIQNSKSRAVFAMQRLKPGIEAYDPCWCSSGKKVKWCHGVIG